MTLIAAWAGLDCKKEGKKIASIYFASDSRFSWGNGDIYDEGMKVFCSLKYPYIFAYCGDVIFPIHTIERIIFKIDCGLLFNNESKPFKEKLKDLENEIKVSLMSYPFIVKFSIFFASRESTYDFHVGRIKCENQELSSEEIDLPEKSDIIFIDGSGSNHFKDVCEKNHKDPNEGYSRYYYHCISKAITECNDETLGGSPQVVGLFRKGPGIIFGIIENGERYILGKKINYTPNLLNFHWRNSNFERVNPESMNLMEGAQRQPFIE